MRTIRLFVTVCALFLMNGCKDGMFYGPLTLFDSTASTPTSPGGAVCNNNVKDGNESDIDCGPGCGLCADTRTCSSNDHCASNRCEGGKCVSAFSGGANISPNSQPARSFSTTSNWVIAYAKGGLDSTRSPGRYCAVGNWQVQTVNSPTTLNTSAGEYVQLTCCEKNNLNNCQPTPNSGCWKDPPLSQPGCTFERDCNGVEMIICVR